MQYQNLKLNGKNYSKEELALLVKSKLQQKKLSEYERSLFSFIKEWLALGSTIKLKTSGSTGVPKLITVRKEQMIASAKMTCKYFHLTPKSNLLLCLSADFIAGKMMVIRALVSGANLIVVEPNGNPLNGFKQKIDFVAMVPLQVENSLSGTVTRKVFENITSVIVGGAAISHSLEKALSKSRNKVYATFAMTETLSHIALRRLTGRQKADVFELLQGVKIKKDKRGCMVVNALKLNDNSISTNDVIEIVDKNHFQWLGRYDNVINSGGIKIFPEKIEGKTSKLIPNNRFFIASLPDNKLGEKVVLVIEGMAVNKVNEVRNKVEKTLSKYERPKDYLVLKEFIETPNGKVKRQETLKLIKNYL
jgi:o-succinylbenzoate---CoA ligase